MALLVASTRPKLFVLRTTGTRVASTSPQLRGRIRNSLCRSSRTMSYARRKSTTGLAVASASLCKWNRRTTTNAGRHRGRATWLILPVVICLSQRLSHACASMNQFELWNCEWLIKSVIVCLMVRATRITVVILELIRATNPDFWEGRIY